MPSYIHQNKKNIVQCIERHVFGKKTNNTLYGRYKFDTRFEIHSNTGDIYKYINKYSNKLQRTSKTYSNRVLHVSSLLPEDSLWMKQTVVVSF